VLTKGPAGIVVPALVVVVFVAWQREPDVLRRLWSWPLACAVLVVDGGWYLLAYRAGGDAFVATQLVRENFDRFVGRGTFRRALRRHGPGRMLGTFVTAFLPWNVALVAAAIRRARGVPLAAADRLLHAWWAVVLVVFTLSAGRRGVYLLPIAPAIAMLAARALLRALEARSGVRAAEGGLLLPARPLAVVALALIILDGAALAGCQMLRHHYAGRRSLAEFAAEVRRRVPPEAVLYASFGLPESQFLVLEYRLQRPLDRRRSTCGDAYVLVSEAEVWTLPARGGTLLAVSGRPRAAVGLVREPVCPEPS
jgi:hypothetical protein